MDNTNFLDVKVHRGAHSAVIFEVVGVLDLAFSDQLRKALIPAVHNGTVVLDASKVTFCDSSGLRVLLEANRDARTHGAVFRVASASQPVMRVFALTGADNFLDVFPDVEAALVD